MLETRRDTTKCLFANYILKYTVFIYLIKRVESKPDLGSGKAGGKQLSDFSHTTGELTKPSEQALCHGIIGMNHELFRHNSRFFLRISPRSVALMVDSLTSRQKFEEQLYLTRKKRVNVTLKLGSK